MKSNGEPEQIDWLVEFKASAKKIGGQVCHILLENRGETKSIFFFNFLNEDANYYNAEKWGLSNRLRPTSEGSIHIIGRQFLTINHFLLGHDPTIVQTTGDSRHNDRRVSCASWYLGDLYLGMKWQSDIQDEENAWFVFEG